MQNHINSVYFCIYSSQDLSNMQYLQLIFVICIHSAISINFKNGQEYVFKVTDQHFSAINIKGRVIPPLDTVFEGELNLRVLLNNTYYGQFLNTIWYGNVNNKGNLEKPFLIEMKEKRIDNIQVSNAWEKKGVRYVYDILNDLLRDYSSLAILTNSVDNLSVNLSLGHCNATVHVFQNSDEKIIEAKCDKSKCELDQDLIDIIGEDAADLFTDDTFNEVKIHQKLNKEEEPFAKLEVTMNIRGEDPLKDFLVAMVSNTEVTYVDSKPSKAHMNLGDDLIKHFRREILEY